MNEKDLTGQRFGRLVALRKIDRKDAYVKRLFGEIYFCYDKKAKSWLNKIFLFRCKKIKITLDNSFRLWYCITTK